jgi:hypothetical protein
MKEWLIRGVASLKGGLPRQFEPMIYHTHGEYANHYTIDAVKNLRIILII